MKSEKDFLTRIESRKMNTFKNGEYAISTLKSIKKYVEKGIISFEATEFIIDENLELQRIFDCFHKVASKMKTRHEDRTVLEIKDEYDVQYLMYALLQLYFDRKHKPFYGEFS